MSHNLHYLQHVPFEDPAGIRTWAETCSLPVSGTRLFLSESPPPVSRDTILVVLGGPMNIYEDDVYPWLSAEKRYIEQAIAIGAKVIGICLGAQLIADVLGARVYKNHYKEIGWFPVLLTAAGKQQPAFNGIPDTFLPFHWHGDMFDIPAGAICTAYSEGCASQSFVYDNRVIGLQYHIEVTPASVARLIAHCADEIISGKYVMTPEEMTGDADRYAGIGKVLSRFLHNLM